MASADMSQTLRTALEQLREEKDRIENAIVELERLVNSLSGVRRRGRPPGSGKRGPGRPPGRKNGNASLERKGWSDQARQAAAQRMKRYWADRRKQKDDGK
ncbi:MAG: hypothetical protein H7Z43_02385 [Clostridia bacterium]|nr:hypothetical protein [Deltaproteobacteria bacterium]